MDYVQLKSEAESSKRPKSNVVVTVTVEQDEVRSVVNPFGLHIAGIEMQCTMLPLADVLADRVVVPGLSEHDNPLVSLYVTQSAVLELCTHMVVVGG